MDNEPGSPDSIRELDEVDGIREMLLKPRYYTKDDVVKPDRLRGFSDAVFATAATLLVVPVRRFDIRENETLKDALFQDRAQIIIFLVGFMVICSIWESQFIRQKIIGKTDDILVVLNLISLMVVTFLPFGLSLASNFPSRDISVVIIAFLMFIIEILEWLMLGYGFRNPQLWSSRFRNLEKDKQNVKKKQVHLKMAGYCVLFLIAGLVAWKSLDYTGYVLISLVVFIPVVVPYSIKFYRRRMGNLNATRFRVFAGHIKRERMETFTDGALVIVATLLVMDLSLEEFPSEMDINEHGLVYCLKAKSYIFTAYLGTFLVIGIIWFIHHSVVNHFKVFTPVLVIVNKVFLAFVALSPFVSSLVTKYSHELNIETNSTQLNITTQPLNDQNSENFYTAVAFSSCIICIASSTNVILLVASLCNKQTTLRNWNNPGSRGRKSLIYLILKTILVPFLSLVTLIVSVTVTSNVVVNWTFKVCIIAAPLGLILLKFILACSCVRRQDGSAFYSVISTEDGGGLSDENKFKSYVSYDGGDSKSIDSFS